jgi:uncharacterized small protein (DUF1192 family)
MDEEEARPKPVAGVGRDLRQLSVSDLETYVHDLKAEIARVEAELARRRDVRGAAEALFRRASPSGGEPG